MGAARATTISTTPPPMSPKEIPTSTSGDEEIAAIIIFEEDGKQTLVYDRRNCNAWVQSDTSAEDMGIYE